MDEPWQPTAGIADHGRASSGFGRAIAEAALAVGDIVVAAARRTGALADLVASAPERVSALALDVTDTDRIRAAVAEVLDRHGRVDDPAKAAAAILLALDSPDPPLRLALGNDAVDTIAESLDGAKAELAAWERVGRSAVSD